MCGVRWCPGSVVPQQTFSMKVYSDSTLGLREFEAARLRIAQINGCLFCQDWRTERDGEKVEGTFDPGRAESGRRPTRSTRRTRLAAEYAELLADRSPQHRRRVLEADACGVRPARDRRARHVPGLMARVRSPQPRARPRHRVRPARRTCRPADAGPSVRRSQHPGHRSILETGAAAVRRFASGGGLVYAASRDQAKLAEVAASCADLPGRSGSGHLDVSSAADCRAAIAATVDAYGRARRAGKQRGPT